MILGFEKFNTDRLERDYYRVVYICRKCGGVCVSFRTFDGMELGNSKQIIKYSGEWMLCCLCFGTDWDCRYCRRRKNKGGK